MPTYYNGKEITSTSKLSGLSLVGRSSITIGGKVTTLSTPPPPSPEMSVYGDSSGASGYPDPGTACMFGAGGTPLRVFVKDNGDGSFSLFKDKAFTIPIGPGWWWSDDTSNIGGGASPEGSPSLVDPSGLVVMISRC
jgi:hypothetical protein